MLKRTLIVVLAAAFLLTFAIPAMAMDKSGFQSTYDWIASGCKTTCDTATAKTATKCCKTCGKSCCSTCQTDCGKNCCNKCAKSCKK